MNKDDFISLRADVETLLTEALGYMCVTPSVGEAKCILSDIRALLVCRAEELISAPSDRLTLVRFYSDQGWLRSGASQIYASLFNKIDACAKKGIDSNATIADFYQALIGLNISIAGDTFGVGITKSGRDSLGSYYTSRDFASLITERALNQLSQGGSIEHEIKVADLSCGAGDFLLGLLNQLTLRGMDPKQAYLSIWGYDLDPTALIIAFSELTNAAGVSYYSDECKTAVKHFKFGNVLLGTEEPGAPANDRIALCAEGCLYDQRLGLPPSAYPAEGFDIIVGNPPWEKIRFEERKFFKLLDDDIANASNRRTREALISSKQEGDKLGLYELRNKVGASYGSVKRRVANSGVHLSPGEPNTYALFTNLAMDKLSAKGVAALVLKSALVTSPVNSPLFFPMLQNGTIRELFMFSNHSGVFPIDRRERFCVLVFGRELGQTARVSFGNDDIKCLCSSPTTLITPEDLLAINPTTGTIPDLGSAAEYEILVSVQKRLPVFGDVYPDSHFGRLVHLTTHASSIHPYPQDGCIGIVEGKFIWQHDMRFSTFEGMSDEEKFAPKASARIMSTGEKTCSKPCPRYCIDESKWASISRKYDKPMMLCWRSLTSSTNRRTTIAALSVFLPACQSVQFLQLEDVESLVILDGLFNSKAFDYLVRLKLPGIDLTQAVIRQIPVPRKEVYQRQVEYMGVSSSFSAHICNRVISFYKGEGELLEQLGESNLRYEPINRPREELTKELDDLFYLCYAYSDKEIEAIEDSFS